MKTRNFTRWLNAGLWLAASTGVALSAGCGSLLPSAVTPPRVYTLDAVRGTAPLPRPDTSAPTLIVNPPRAAPGFDSTHIVYVRVAHQLEHFAHSNWIDTPAPRRPSLVRRKRRWLPRRRLVERRHRR